MKIYKIYKYKGKICNDILRALPDWFAVEKSIQKYVKDVKKIPMFICKINIEVVGFLALKIHNPFTAEVYVMGVLPEFHRQNVGSQLLEKAETYLRHRKIEFLTVKTLSPSDSYKPYKKTRSFYTHRGFKPVEDFGTKIWGKDNPCLLMLKKL